MMNTNHVLAAINDSKLPKSRSILAVIALLAISGSTVFQSGAEANGSSADQSADPDFGPNVLVFDPSMTNIQNRIDAVFTQQERSQFGSNRYAYFFKPGKYDLDVQVGFYTQVLGLGQSPDDVAITPRDNSPGTQIQACAGLDQNSSALAVCLANIGDTPELVTIPLGRRATGAPASVQVPSAFAPETPLHSVSDLTFRDAQQDTLSLTLCGYSAAFIEIPLRDNR